MHAIVHGICPNTTVGRFSRTVTSSIQIPETLRPSLTKAAVLFLVCLLFVVCGIWMIREGKPMGYFCGGFFALGLPVFALQFHPKAAYLHLAADGFTFCSLFRAHTVRWEHGREFAVIQVGPNRMVAWNFTSDYPATGPRNRCPATRRRCQIPTA